MADGKEIADTDLRIIKQIATVLLLTFGRRHIPNARIGDNVIPYSPQDAAHAVAYIFQDPKQVKNG